MIFRDSGIGGKTAIVTGGGRGIGREIVKVLAAEGADVTFFYLKDQEAADALQTECVGLEGRVAALQVDVRNAEECGRTVESVLDRTDRVDILVNNAGVIRDNLLPAFTEDEISDVLATNVLGVFHVTGAVAPVMMRQRGGTIINISSVAGEKGGKGQTNYAASKGAINAFTRALAVELAPRKIRVNAVAPGLIDTEMTREVRELAGEQALDRILLGRYGTPAEVAAVVCFLASRYGEYINGEIIHVDGGFKMK
ncbi:MAG: 3-oxoacyl-ACP reductase FabG [Thermoanaerobaculales bacterium]|jgi:3-oxoacyl-[acyl-carrier protein] reductase|nr:3-oxoacyl-ACP reductase FabG [Thermoanaerobaculales bacterium]